MGLELVAARQTTKQLNFGCLNLFQWKLSLALLVWLFEAMVVFDDIRGSAWPENTRCLTTNTITLLVGYSYKWVLSELNVLTIPRLFLR